MRGTPSNNPEVQPPALSRSDLARLKRKAREIRRNVLVMAKGKGEGYVGQGLGSADILAACYFHAMRYDPKQPEWEDRDRFVLSTGHYAIVLYAALTAAEFFSEELLPTYGADESPFTMATCETTPGVEITGGSLGQGLCQAVGMALGARRSGRDFRVFNFLSDGELQEGATWEAAMAAAHFGLDNLIALVDVNDIQADGKVSDLMTIEPVADKWNAFGWHVQSVDGNSMEALVEALEQTRNAGDKPHVVVCYTLMGKGVPFLETRPKGHFIRVEPDEWARALRVLEQAEV